MFRTPIFHYGKNLICKILASISVTIFAITPHLNAQGTWTALTNTAPDFNEGVMILLSDGTVMVKTSTGGFDSYGNTWDLLIPDDKGSYKNGTWLQLPPMNDTRLYFASRMLKDGRVYVAGGEYGTGKASTELYDPVNGSWAPASPIPTTDSIYDGNSEILPDGRVLQTAVGGSYGRANYIFDPNTNAYTVTMSSLNSSDESCWLKLPDSSILFVEHGSTYSERYIPSLNTWVSDGTVPVQLYDNLILESGAGFLLPNGKAFFLGSTGHTAYYTPSGNTTPGSWAAGPNIPGGLGTPDAAGAMMANGRILCAVSPPPTFTDWFPTPTYFYDFNYTTNTFTKISAPIGGDTMSMPCYMSNMLDLPDGSVLFSNQGSNQYYLYEPTGTPLIAGRPTIDTIIKINCDTFMATGKLFNGITEGAAYGDDWQMATNYPLVRLNSATNVYYARSFNWNRTGVMTGAQPDTTYFSLPATMPKGIYSLQVVANGNPSLAKQFKTCGLDVPEISANEFNDIHTYPNPTNGQTDLMFNAHHEGTYNLKISDINGSIVKNETALANAGKNVKRIDLNGLAKGIYIITIGVENNEYKTKIVID